MDSPSAAPASMTVTTFGELIVQIHGRAAPTDADWDRFCGVAARVAATHRDGVRCLAITDGGSPSGAQRDRLTRVVEVPKYPCAVIGASAGVRFSVAAISLFHPHIRSFAPGELGQALAHLRLDASLAPTIRASLPGLALEIGGSRTIAAMLAS